ncbi:hypothetical protein ACFL6F_01245 [Planctomycetota bacterium]
MDLHTVIGVLIVIVSLGLLTFLTLWARKSINTIGKNGYVSPRKRYKDNGDE